MTKTLGPRIFIKTDAESSVGRGCVLHSAHWRPEIAVIPRIAAACAPASVAEVHLTEGYRDIRDERDLHEELCAFDITFRNKGDPERRIERPELFQYQDCARRMSIFLGPDYDVVAHGDGMSLHIHCEYEGGR